MLVQAGPCNPANPNPPPCCGPPNTCGGGPPPPIGLPIDSFIYVLVFAALVFGIYTITKKRKIA